MAWIIIPVVLIAAWFIFMKKQGGLDFWKLASKYPYAAHEMFQEQDCWHVFTEEPQGGYRASLPPGEWAGPFKLFLPLSGSGPVTIFGKVPDYEEAQQDFISRMRGSS